MSRSLTSICTQDVQGGRIQGREYISYLAGFKAVVFFLAKFSAAVYIQLIDEVNLNNINSGGTPTKSLRFLFLPPVPPAVRLVSSGLSAMAARWIPTLACGRAPFLDVLGLQAEV